MGRIMKLFSFTSLMSLLLPLCSYAAGGGPVAPMVIVADTRKLSGIMAWWANMYNESHIQFALMTVLIIPIIGVVFGVVADIVMTHMGIDLSHRDLAEH